MTRVELGAILATILLFVAISVIRGIVVPIVRRRVGSYRAALAVPSRDAGDPASGHANDERRLADASVGLNGLRQAPAAALTENGDKGGHAS